MISELVARIRQERGLTQQQLADLLGVPLQRVKRLSRNEVKNLTQDEMEALGTRLRVRPEWILSNGQGPIFMSQAEHAQWLAAHAIPAAMHDQIRRLQEEAPAWPESGPPRNTAEAELLANWRACSKKDRDTVSNLAARLAKP